MARARSVFALSALPVAATTVATCTPSVSSSAPRDPFASPIVPGQNARASSSTAGHGTIGAPTPRSGSGTPTVALVDGAQLPMETAQELTKATGFTVVAVPVDDVDALSKAGVDVVLDLDGADTLQATAADTIAASAPQNTTTLAGAVVDGAVAAIAYGRNNVCIIADKSWMSANGRPLPISFDDLTSPRIRVLLMVPDPASSSVGRAFVQGVAAQTGEGLGPFAQPLNPRVDPSLGGAIAAWAAGAHVSEGYLSEVVGASVGSSDAYPLIVAPRSLAAAAAMNTGADSYGTVISPTCIARIMYAAPTSSPASDGAEFLIAWLQGETVQRSLATTGAVYPIDDVLAADTKAGWLMGITGDPIVADEAVGSLDAMSTWLATWTPALASPASAAPSTPDSVTDPGTQDVEPEPAPADDPTADTGYEGSSDDRE